MQESSLRTTFRMILVEQIASKFRFRYVCVLAIRQVHAKLFVVWQRAIALCTRAEANGNLDDIQRGDTAGHMKSRQPGNVRERVPRNDLPLGDRSFFEQHLDCWAVAWSGIDFSLLIAAVLFYRLEQAWNARPSKTAFGVPTRSPASEYRILRRRHEQKG